MSTRHLQHWPRHLATHLDVPETSLWYNAEVSAARFPHKPYLVFYDTEVSFSQFRDEAEKVAGFLQQRCGVKKGDRVLLYMQNCPQFAIAYYGILRADAVVVPVNPMNLTDELRHYVDDADATTAIVAQELYPRIAPLTGKASGAGLSHVIVAAYSDYATAPTTLNVPDFVAAPRQTIADPGVSSWMDVIAHDLRPGPHTAGPDDLCVMPYTSGTTGKPKGCMHSHRTVMSTAVGGAHWFAVYSDCVFLSVVPLFHVTGMQGAMNGTLYSGNTVILLPRWERDAAARCIHKYRVTSWTAIPPMIFDLLAHPQLAEFDLSSMRRLSGGGAAMPEAVAQQLLDRGITYVEGYGLSETIAPSHINPPDRPKKQCLGIPIFDVDARVLDPSSLAELPVDEVGEIVIHGPQVFLGYWKNDRATADSFIELDGKRFFRTGDLGRVDQDGYFFMVDRLKRMINASGFKVWPAEVESMLFEHPSVREACVVAARDPRRGETVKAIVVLRDADDPLTEAQFLEWCHQKMAAYKAPRIVEFVEQLPRSGTGKILWRALQEQELARS